MPSPSGFRLRVGAWCQNILCKHGTSNVALVRAFFFIENIDNIFHVSP